MVIHIYSISLIICCSTFSLYRLQAYFLSLIHSQGYISLEKVSGTITKPSNQLLLELQLHFRNSGNEPVDVESIRFGYIVSEGFKEGEKKEILNRLFPKNEIILEQVLEGNREERRFLGGVKQLSCFISVQYNGAVCGNVTQNFFIEMRASVVPPNRFECFFIMMEKSKYKEIEKTIPPEFRYKPITKKFTPKRFAKFIIETLKGS